MANNSSSLLPGANPTGLPRYGEGGGFVPGAGTSSGANPMLPAPNLPASAPISNPYDTSVVPTFGANAGPYKPSNLFGPAAPGTTNASTAAASPIGGMNLMSPTDIKNMYNTLKSVYGDGTAHAILDFLTSGAGFNQSAINNLFAALQPGIERGTESLMNQFSTTGNRFGSGAQIGLGDYLSQVQLNEGQIETQMYEQSINDYINTLMGVGSAEAQHKASSPSIWDEVLGGLGAAASVAAAPFTGGLSLAGLGPSLGLVEAGQHTGGGGGGSPSYVPITSTGIGGGSSSAIPDSVPIVPSMSMLNPENASIYDISASLTGGNPSSFDPSGAYSGYF